MSTLILLENQPPGQDEAIKMALLASGRSELVVCLCCLPVDSEAFEIARRWDKTIETIRQVVLDHGCELEVLVRFQEPGRVLQERLNRGDIDLVIWVQETAPRKWLVPLTMPRRTAPPCPVLRIPRSVLMQWNWLSEKRKAE